MLGNGSPTAVQEAWSWLDLAFEIPYALRYQSNPAITDRNNQELHSIPFRNTLMTGIPLQQSGAKPSEAEI